MYDRLLKLLAEQGEPERQKTIFDVIKTKEAVEKAKGLTSGEKGQTAAQRRTSRRFGKPTTHSISTSGT